MGMTLVFCESSLWFWNASAVSYTKSTSRVSEVHLWRMNTDFRYPNVDKSVYLSLSHAHPLSESDLFKLRRSFWSCLNVILTILWILQCRPVAAAWDNRFHRECFPKHQVRVQRTILTQASKFRRFELSTRRSHLGSCRNRSSFIVKFAVTDFSFAAQFCFYEVFT